jgi:hypothetical protein
LIRKNVCAINQFLSFCYFKFLPFSIKFWILFWLIVDVTFHGTPFFGVYLRPSELLIMQNSKSHLVTAGGCYQTKLCGVFSSCVCWAAICGQKHVLLWLLVPFGFREGVAPFCPYFWLFLPLFFISTSFPWNIWALKNRKTTSIHFFIHMA